MWQVLEAIHSELVVATEVEYVHSLRALAAHTSNEDLGRWAMFAGGAVTSKAMTVVSAYLEQR